MGKSFTIGDLTMPKEGWDYFENRMRKLIYFRVDLNAINVIKTISNNEIMVGEIKFDNTISRKEALYVSYREIYDKATELGIIPELLIDEDYYYSRVKLTPYRILFGALRNGKDAWDIYVELLKQGRKLRPITFIDFIGGKPNTMYFMKLDTVKALCNIAGVEIGDLFRPVYRKRSGNESYFYVLKSIIGALDDIDVITLTGIAAILAQSSAKPDRETLEKDLHGLLNWWFGQKEGALYESTSKSIE